MAVTPLAVLAWLEASAPAVAMREWRWLYPGVEIVHIAGIVLLVGAVALFDLRVLGGRRGPAAARLAAELLPWSWVGLALVVPSGLLLFSAQATEWVANPAMPLKLALLGLAAVNAWLFHRRALPALSTDRTGAASRARVAAAVSLLLWIGVIGCGRMLAYL